MRTPKQQRAKERVRLVLEAGKAVLAEEGIKHFNTNTIAARGKFPVSSIYQYFPNKEAILAALYSQYLTEVRESYAVLNTPAVQKLPWREYCILIIKNVAQVDTYDPIDEQFDTALQLYPELREMDKEHAEWMANRMADDMRRLGSAWPRPKLKRLGYLAYELSDAIWRYRADQNPSKKEILEWSQTAFLALISQCMGDD